jgi:Flp pilus assembly protein TadD
MITRLSGGWSLNKYSGLVPLMALLSACSTVRGLSPVEAFDMPSETEKGYAALAAGDNPTAVKWLTVASNAKPDDPYLMVDLAAAYQRLGRFDQAQKLYQTVVDTAQDVTPAKVADPKLQGKSLARVAAADLALCTACAMPPEAGKAYAALADGNDPEAARWLAAAVQAKPDDLYLKLDLAAADRQLGRNDAARTLDQQIIDTAKEPTPPKLPDSPPRARTITELAAADLALLPK